MSTLSSAVVAVTAATAAILMSGCLDHREVASDSSSGARGQLLFDLDGLGTADYYGVVGVPWRVNIARFDPQAVTCGVRRCDEEKHAAIDLVEARCVDGSCTAAPSPRPLAGRHGFDLAVVGAVDGVHTLFVKVKRRDTGAILEDEHEVVFRKASRLAINYDRTEYVSGVRTALLPQGTTKWCTELFDAAGARLHFQHPPASSVFSLPTDLPTGALKVVEILGGEEPDDARFLQLSARAPGRAKVTARLGLLTREVEVRVAADADVQSMEIRQVIESGTDPRTQFGIVDVDVDDVTTDRAVTELAVTEPRGGTEPTLRRSADAC